MMKKRGQAAMEFLMTYGWAILIVLIAIGALVVFVKPGQILGQNCVLSPGLNCESYKADTTGITLLIANSYPKDITVTNINLPDAGCTKAFTTSITSGNSATFVLDAAGCAKESGSQIRSDVVVTYIEESGLTGITNTGSVFLKVP